MPPPLLQLGLLGLLPPLSFSLFSWPHLPASASLRLQEVELKASAHKSSAARVARANHTHLDAGPRHDPGPGQKAAGSLSPSTAQKSAVSTAASRPPTASSDAGSSSGSSGNAAPAADRKRLSKMTPEELVRSGICRDLVLPVDMHTYVRQAPQGPGPGDYELLRDFLLAPRQSEKAAAYAPPEKTPAPKPKFGRAL